MSIYDMLDEFACKLRRCLDERNLTDVERTVGEEVYNYVVGYLTYGEEVIE